MAGELAVAMPVLRVCPSRRRITGHRSEMERLARRLQAEGADAVLCKPVDVPKLLVTLTQFALP